MLKFSIEKPEYHFRINGVEYKDGIYQVDLTTKLLNINKTQDQWVEHSQQAINQNEFYIGDLPLYYAIFTTLYKNKDQQNVEEVRKFLDDILKNQFISTLTKIENTPQGKDKVIHNFRMPNQCEIMENIVGHDEYVKNSANPSVYKALLGTDNIQEINEVFKWITDNDAYLWRVNNKPKKLDTRVAGLGANSYGAVLYCGRDPDFSYSGLGVRAQNF